MSDTAKPRILAVDDSRVMRRAMTKILSSDYEVVEAENGEDAWTMLLNDSDFTVVFTDLNMPYLDGFGLLERIRSAEDVHIHDIPVVIITGKDDDDDTKQRVLDMGASDFITKPFDSVQLKARAKSHVQIKQTATKLSETSDKLEKQSAVDQATGLGGQKYFCKAAEEAIAYSRRHGDSLILLRMDIDNFNNIFIKNGKETADAILKTVGDRLTNTVRLEDTLARIGLSRFAMLLKNTALDDAMRLAERIHADIPTLRFEHNGETITLTVTIAVYEPLLQPEHDIHALLKIADELIAQTTNNGGNAVTVSSDLQQQEENIPVAMEEELSLSAGDEESTTAAAETAIPSLDQMRQMLEAGQIEELKPHLDALLTGIRPLMDFVARHDREKLRAVLATLGK